MTLAELLAPKIQKTFQNISVTVNSQENPFAIFHSPSPEVGEIELYEYNLEIVIGLGKISRCNFEGLKSSATLEDKELFISEVLDFLEDLVSGDIEFYGTSSTGGCRTRTKKPRSFFSKLFLGKRTYTWFGPID